MTTHLSAPGKRLLWNLQQPLHSAISVLPENLDPRGPHEPYFHQGQWHPISNEPITEEPVASITVTEEYLSDWQNEWYTINQEGFNDDEDDDDDTPREGEPPTFEPLVVTASNGRFVSINDYVSAVHPWLMQKRDLILRARHVGDGDDYMPGEEEERLLVVPDNVELVSAQDEDEWMGTLRQVFEQIRQQS